MKRLVVMLGVIIMLCSLTFASPIYKYEDTTSITDTVTLTNVREFHSDYNISYSYIKMDLTDERVRLKLLTSSDGTDVLSYMSDLVKTDENTVAALNADFFSVYSGNKGFSLGIEKKDGEIIQSPINPDTMATVAYDGSNILMTHLDFHVFAVAENWENKEIRHINKHTSYYGDLLMYTHDFGGGYSPAPGGDVVEVVVEDGIVTEFRRGMEPCRIPENGCVLVLSEGSSMFLRDNFEVGSKIKFDWYITPSLDDFDTAFGAGSMLVYEGKDVGKVGDYTHTVAGFNPRSAIGVDKEGKTLYLVAVDGRQTGSRGMRMSHLAELLIELGCYTAVNLDGGGSSRMVASTFWNSEMHPVNNPTENRKVINAIGIVLDNGEEAEPAEEGDETEETENIQNQEEPQEEQKAQEETEEREEHQETEQKIITGIKIKPSKKTALVGEKIGFEVVAHDEQLRPVPFDEEEVSFSVSEGDFEDGFLTSNVGGFVTVSAAFGEHYAEASVYYIENVSGIVTDSVLYMKKDETYELPLYVFDYSGRFIKVENTDAFDIVSSDEFVVAIKDNKILAKNNGSAIVQISNGKAISFVSIAVGDYTFDYLNNFERKTGTFSSYPEDTKGEFELSGDFSLSGSLSGKLSFDFTEKTEAEDVAHPQAETEDEDAEKATQEEISRAVYFSLFEKVVFDEHNDFAEIKVYCEDEFQHEVRAQLVDADGKVKNVKFDGDIAAGEWNTLTLEVPKELKRPVSLARVYVLYTPGEEKDSGSVYIEDLSVVSGRDYKPEIAPQNVYIYNTNNSNVSTSTKVSAVPEKSGNSLVSDYERIRVENTVLSENGIVISEKLEKSVSEDDHAVYVHLDTSGGGIRNTDSSQWELILQAVSSSERDNLFLITNASVFGNDEFENEVIKDYLASVDKNVFVVSPGENATYMNIDGVKYFTVDSTPITDFSLLGEKRKNTVEFFFGDKVTFEFKSI